MIVGSNEPTQDKAGINDDQVSEDQLRSLVLVARHAVRRVQELVQATSETNAIFEHNDIHARLDHDANAIFSQELSKTSVGILSEEEARASKESAPEISGMRWVVDPIDGTYNHWRSIPFASTSVALLRNGAPVFGVIGNLNNGDIYSGGKGIPASKNKIPIRVSTTREYSRAVIATGVPVGTSLTSWTTGMFNAKYESFGKIRMLGSAATTLALLAEGAIDSYWESGIFLWDVSAGIAIASAAGAVVETDHLEGFRFDVRVSTPSLNQQSHCDGNAVG